MKRAHLALVLLLAGAACSGDDEDPNPRPGVPGGLCLAPDGACDEGTCNRARNYCFAPSDPCSGFSCGGSERGECGVDEGGFPYCACLSGYDNESFSHYCCPSAGGDPLCEQEIER